MEPIACLGGSIRSPPAVLHATMSKKINGVAPLTGVSYNNLYGRFAGTKK